MILSPDEKEKKKETHEKGGLYKPVFVMVFPRNQQKKREKNTWILNVSPFFSPKVAPFTMLMCSL